MTFVKIPWFDCLLQLFETSQYNGQFFISGLVFTEETKRDVTTRFINAIQHLKYYYRNPDAFNATDIDTLDLNRPWGDIPGQPSVGALMNYINTRGDARYKTYYCDLYTNKFVHQYLFLLSTCNADGAPPGESADLNENMWVRRSMPVPYKYQFIQPKSSNSIPSQYTPNQNTCAPNITTAIPVFEVVPFFLMTIIYCIIWIMILNFCCMNFISIHNILKEGSTQTDEEFQEKWKFSRFFFQVNYFLLGVIIVGIIIYLTLTFFELFRNSSLLHSFIFPSYKVNDKNISQLNYYNDGLYARYICILIMCVVFVWISCYTFSLWRVKQEKPFLIASIFLFLLGMISLFTMIVITFYLD